MSQDLAAEFADVQTGVQMPLTGAGTAQNDVPSADEVEAAYERALQRLNGEQPAATRPKREARSQKAAETPGRGKGAPRAQRGVEQPAPVKPPKAPVVPPQESAPKPGPAGQPVGTRMTPGDGLPPVRGGARNGAVEAGKPLADGTAVVRMTPDQAQQIVDGQFARLRDEVVGAVRETLRSNGSTPATRSVSSRLGIALLGGALIATWFLRGAVDGHAERAARTQWLRSDLPGLKHTLSTPLGAHWIWMAAHNPPGSLSDIERCAAAAGLRLTHGVCAGAGAREGWRPSQ